MGVIKRIHRSGIMSKVYRVLPFVGNTLDRMYRIYKGDSHLMTNRLYWHLYLVFKYLRQGCRLLHKSRIRYMKLPIDGTDVIYINPARLEYSLMPSENERENTAVVEDGRWDLKRVKLEDTFAFQAIYEHFTKKVPLSGAKYEQIDKIFRDIKEKGYRTQKELGRAKPDDGIIVVIDRSGKFLLKSGIIRLVIARVLGLTSIPVIVSKRHYLWAIFRKEVFDYSQEQPKGAYQPLIHPDLQKMPSHRKEVRWEYIKNNLPINSGTVLDIGANWGYFCHKFEDLGFMCYAVENNLRWLYFMKRLKEIEDKKFEIIDDSVFNIKRKQYDIVLALSIFHHFLRSEALRDKLAELLGELDMKIMFFEPHNVGQVFKNIHINYEDEKFVDFVIKNSCLKQHKFLGVTERGRNMYLLTR